MNTEQLIGLLSLSPCYPATSKEISAVYCCDLLSLAMVKAPQNCCWVTVMANRNTIAVATIAEAACVILAEGIHPSPEMLTAAKEHHIPLFTSSHSVFATAKAIDQLLSFTD